MVVEEILVLKCSPNLGSTEHVATKMNNNQVLGKITFIDMKKAHGDNAFYFRNFFTVRMKLSCGDIQPGANTWSEV